MSERFGACRRCNGVGDFCREECSDCSGTGMAGGIEDLENPLRIPSKPSEKKRIMTHEELMEFAVEALTRKMTK